MSSTSVRLCSADEGGGAHILAITLDPQTGVSWSSSSTGEGRKRRRRRRAAWPPDVDEGEGGSVGWRMVLSVRHLPPSPSSSSSPSPHRASNGLKAPLNPPPEEDVEAPLPLPLPPPLAPSAAYTDADWLPPSPSSRALEPRPQPRLHTLVVYFAQEEVRGGGGGGGKGGPLAAWWRRRRWRPRRRQDPEEEEEHEETRLRARSLVFRTSDGAAAAAAAALASDAIAADSAHAQGPTCRRRPRRLLVLVNPSSGSRAAARVWRRAVAPALLLSSGLRVDALRTRARGEAERRCAEAAAAAAAGEAPARYCGALAVGGDGLFQELLAGASSASPSSFRIGHVPAGSTDAAAHALHGGRDAETAALAAALGLGGRLDVALMRLLPSSASGPSEAAAAQQPPTTVPFCCMASSGFLADVLSASERLPRALLGGGPRYDLAGLWAFLRLRARPAHIEYLPCLAAGDEEEEGKERWVPLVAASPPRQPPAALFSSIKVAVTACRSDRSRRGVAPGLGCDDGRLLLAAFQGASRLAFLRYLLRLAARGLSAEEEDGSQRGGGGGGAAAAIVVHASAVRVGWDRPWNVDGELVRPVTGGGVEVRVRKGAVGVFSAMAAMARRP